MDLICATLRFMFVWVFFVCVAFFFFFNLKMKHAFLPMQSVAPEKG